MYLGGTLKQSFLENWCDNGNKETPQESVHYPAKNNLGSSPFMEKLIENSEALNEIKDPNNKSIEGKLFRNKDFTEESIRQAYHNLDQKIEKLLIIWVK